MKWQCPSCFDCVVACRCGTHRFRLARTGKLDARTSKTRSRVVSVLTLSMATAAMDALYRCSTELMAICQKICCYCWWHARCFRSRRMAQADADIADGKFLLTQRGGGPVICIHTRCYARFQIKSGRRSGHRYRTKTQHLLPSGIPPTSKLHPP